MHRFDVFPSFVFSFNSLRFSVFENGQLRNTPPGNTFSKHYKSSAKTKRVPQIFSFCTSATPQIVPFQKLFNEFETLHYNRRKEKEACPFGYAPSLHPGVRLVSSDVIRGNRIIGRSLPYGICVPIVPNFGKQSTSVEHHFNGKVPIPSYLVPCQTCGPAFLGTMQGLR